MHKICIYMHVYSTTESVHNILLFLSNSSPLKRKKNNLNFICYNIKFIVSIEIDNAVVDLEHALNIYTCEVKHIQYIEIVILLVCYNIPFTVTLFWHFLAPFLLF